MSATFPITRTYQTLISSLAKAAKRDLPRGPCIDMTRAIVGADVFKEFEGVVHHGVVRYVMHPENWCHVVYDDGDQEDLAIWELVLLLQETERRKWVPLPTRTPIIGV